MFKFNPSPLQDTLLFKEDTTLEEVLDQESVLQELKTQNKKLIDFITRADIMNQLVGLVIDEPSDQLEEVEKYRRPNIACEVLTTDIPIVNERLSDKALLTKLYSFLERDPPLNPLLASFFSRTLSMLICRKADQNWYSYQFTCLQFLDFLKTKENSLTLLLKHLGTSAIMDLTLKLITQIEGSEMQNNLLDWIESEGLIEKIVDLFDSKVDEGRHYNAAQLLCDTVRKRGEMSSDLDHILHSIQSPETVQKLLGLMLNGDHDESSIVGGITVLLTLLESPISETNNRRGYNSVEDSGSGEPPPSPNPAVQSIVSAIVPFLPAFHDLLLNPPKKEPMKLACGTIEPPLGITRLSVIKLIAALIATNTPEVNAELDRLNTVQVLLDLFFHYTWNNFLHSQVDKCLALALNSSDPESLKENPLIHSIFVKCRLLQRLLEAWEDNETEQSKRGGKRRGYMGHLTNIANSVIKQGDCLLNFIIENTDETTSISWSNYIQNTLQPINDLHSRVLGGSHPANSSNNEDDFDDGSFPLNASSFNQGGSHPANSSNNEDDFNDASFPNESSLNQSFSDFCNYINNYSFDSSRDGNTSLGDNSKDGDEMREISEDMFSPPDRAAVLAQKKAFADFESGMDEDDVWKDGAVYGWNNSDDCSSSSDEEGDKDSPKRVKDESGALFEHVDPWGNASSRDSNENEKPAEEEGWADFSAFDQQFAQNDVSQPMKEDNLKVGNSSASDVIDEVQKKDNLLPKDIQPPEDNLPPKDNLPPEDSSLPQKEISHNEVTNANDLVLEDVPEEELIDNFRFLSIQGLISDKNASPSKNEEAVEAKHQEDTKVLERSGEAAKRSQSPARQPDPV